MYIYIYIYIYTYIRIYIYIYVYISLYIHTHTHTHTNTHVYLYYIYIGTYIHDLTFEPLSTCPCSNTDTDINKSAAHERGAGSVQESPRDTHTSVGLPHTLL